MGKVEKTEYGKVILWARWMELQTVHQSGF
jgi:hypothetical protein